MKKIYSKTYFICFEDSVTKVLRDLFEKILSENSVPKISKNCEKGKRTSRMCKGCANKLCRFMKKTFLLNDILIKLNC